jgi:xylulokinase
LLPQPRPDFDELSRLASEANDAVMIEPHRNLEPLEHCFRHVQPDHSVGQVVRGIMRCVAGALKNQVDSIAGGVIPVEIRAAGGGARSDLWLQMKADLLGIPFVSLECEEPTSLGAAILAAHGIGMGSVEEIAGKWVRVRKRFTPGGALRS